MALLEALIRHRVAANLLMLLMLLAGVWGLQNLNTQLFPTYHDRQIFISVNWPGASAEDVERLVTQPIEQQIAKLSEVRKVYSSSRRGRVWMRVQFPEDADMMAMLDKLKAQVAQVRNLPGGAEAPRFEIDYDYDPIARLLITADAELAELAPLVRRIERDLLALGVANVELRGFPEQQLSIEISMQRLAELNLSLAEIAERIRQISRDVPAGSVGSGALQRQLRSLEQQRDVLGFEQLPLQTDAAGRLIRLGDVARVYRQPVEKFVSISYRGQPAIELRLLRDADSDSLAAARALYRWLEQVRPTLGPGVEIKLYDEYWQVLADRIQLLFENGISGLLLVLAVLFLFLNGRVAWWVALGIPVAFMATLAALALLGGSINMMTLAAMIMALGIVVDDAIVVGEDVMTHYQRGESALAAAVGGARRMLAPITCSTLTTIAAFLPLTLIDGSMGALLFAIPLVMICVLSASLLECFLVLPGHLHHSLHGLRRREPSRFRRWFDGGFERFRDGAFRPLARYLIQRPSLMLALAASLLLVTAALLGSGRLPFTFFPSPESGNLSVNVQFASGTRKETVSEFLLQVERALDATERHFGGNLVKTSVTRHQMARFEGRNQFGSEYGSIRVELVAPDQRRVSNDAFIRHWYGLIERPALLENFKIEADKDVGRGFGADLALVLSGSDADSLKRGADELALALAGYPGVYNIENNLPYGHAQWIYRLTPEGRAAGLTPDSLGRQLRAAFDGEVVQVFNEGGDEVEVKVQLPAAERESLSSLRQFPVRTADGSMQPLANLVTLESRQGLSVLRHYDGRLSVRVQASVDPERNNANALMRQLRRDVLPEILSRHGLKLGLDGVAAEQQRTLSDLALGAVTALALIYIVLAWVFASYSWPLVVISIIPLGLAGAVGGHWLLGLDLTLLSLFGGFAVAGIVVNDSIILVNLYRELRAQGLPLTVALEEAACQRLRAVIITSLTTVAGLLPLLFETSPQAQFLVPMVVSLVFGLSLATLLVLLTLPALLRVVERLRGDAVTQELTAAG